MQHDRPNMLMNTQPNDGSPGGAPSPGASAPTAPAQGTAPSEPSMIDQLSKLIDSKLVEQRNGIFADLRKSGAFGKGKATEPESQTASPSSSPTQPTSTEDVQTLIARERAFSRATAGAKLTDSLFNRMERAWQAEKPDDTTGWVRDYLADVGVQQQAAAGAQQSQTQALPRSAHPVSDGGSPAPATTVPSDQIDPWRLSEDDTKSIIRRDGIAKAGADFRTQMHRALSGRRIRLK